MHYFHIRNTIASAIALQYSAAMSPCSHTAILDRSALRSTPQRRLVMDALHRMKEPVSPYDIGKFLEEQGDPVHPVTIYRITEQFEKLGILHRLGSGRLSLCKHPEQNGAHGYLRCRACGSVTEFQNEHLQRLTANIAGEHNYQSPSPLVEITGLCPSCISSSISKENF